MGKAKDVKDAKRKRSADELTKASEKASIEMSENELDKISGGPIYMKYQSPS